MIAWFYSALKPYWTWVLLGTSAMLLGVGAELAPPWLFAIVIDDVLGDGQIELLSKIVLALLGCCAAVAVFTMIRMATMHILAQRMVYDLRLRVHSHLQKLSLSYFESNSTGDIMSRLSNDVGAVENMVSHGTDSIIGDAVRLVALVVLMLLALPKLAFWTLIPVPLFIVAIIWFGRKIRPYYEKVRDQLGEINAHLQENITGIRVVKAFAREKHEEGLFKEASLKYYEAYCKGVKMWTTFFPSMGFLTSLSVLAIVWFGGRMAHYGSDVTPGKLVMFLGYMQMFYGPVRSLMGVHNMFNAALAALARIFVVLDTKPDITDSPDATEIGRIDGRVEFDEVSFKYHTGEQVLEKVTITAEAGETVAVVGRSGAGKTSIINLIPRFYDPMSGGIRVDGVDLREMTVHSLRSQIAIVLQDTFLFDDTVRENIRYGRLASTVEEAAKAAKAAFAHEFITEDLPDGYRSRAAGRPSHPHSRRGHQFRRYRGRACHSGGDQPVGQGAHDLRHRPPALNHRQRRPDPGA